ncbi:MAG TPA: CPBP family intramembrane glutamic endopeptidase [Verrucomicrobiae bacterium]|jgi:membrane protease YdiL (CAAX protease family)|nr:CPBP family intramembrane glutamic endopeptidase [Verrucomicrobiae bacterium]
MEITPPQVTGLDPMIGQTLPPVKKLLAPVWHTGVLVAIILGNSFAGFFYKPSTGTASGPVLLYSFTFVFELLLFLFIWIWVRRSGTSMRELIGGRWNTPEDVLLDLGLAFGFFVVAGLIIALVRIALGDIDLHNLNKLAQEAKRTLGPLIPRSGFQAGLFLLLSVSAGLFEEIIFRGYLQKQIAAMAGNAYAGILGSGVTFGAAHAYQGGRGMIAIGVFGVLFGILAHLRKSLRPGMIAHATQDAYAGLALFFFFR